MDVLELLAEASAAGLTVVLDGDRLLVKGPSAAAPIARQIGARKPEVLDLLRSVPAPCRTCGCCLGWRTASGVVACCQCSPKPTNASVLLYVDLPEPHWTDYQAERRRHEQRHDHAVDDTVVSLEERIARDREMALGEPDPWEAAIPWISSTPSCPTCGTAAGWVDGLDAWHCWRCSPPRRAQRLLDDREQVLRRAIQAARRYAARPKPTTPPPARPRWQNKFNPDIGF